MHLSSSSKEKVLEHARSEFPRECCGLIIIERGHEVYVPCKNASATDKSFVIDSNDYIKAASRGDIVSVVHSHCNQRAKPSQIDLVSCETTKLPWHIVALPNEEWAYFEPSGYKAPLFGRSYQYGVLDCYTLVVDYYREQMGIELNPHLDRPDKWWETGGNLFMDLFEKEGFRVVDSDKLQNGDVLIIQIGAKVPNHVAVFLEPNLMLHHHQNRLSTRDVYGGHYRKHTRCAVRYFGENRT